MARMIEEVFFDDTSLGLLEDYPELGADGDLGRQNAGIMLVEVVRRKARA